MTRDKFFNKRLCLIWLIAAFLYGIMLPFFWGNDPWDPLGTLSVLCAQHKPFFWLWVLICCGGNFINTNYMYKKYGGGKKIFFALSAAALVSACVIALTLGHPVTNWNPKRIAHWISTGLYVALLGFSIVLYCAVNIKRNKRFAVPVIAAAGISLIFVGWLLILGKSGVHEMIPYTLLQLLLFLMNYTDIIIK